MRFPVILAALVLFLGGFWASGIPVLHFHAQTAAAAYPAGTRQWAEVRVLSLYPPPQFVDPATNLARNNTGAYCAATGGGAFACRVVFGTTTGSATVAADGTVTYP